MKFLILIAITVLAIFVGSNQSIDCFSDSLKYKNINTTPPIDFYNKQMDFSIKLFQIINSFYGHENIFFSPHSTYHSLLLAYFLANNTTLIKLRRTLQIEESAEKLQTYVAYKQNKKREETKVDTGVEFKSANRIYFEKSLITRSCFKDLFVDELFGLDFSNNPDESRLIINNWVQNYTNNMIKDLLSYDAINSFTNIVLVNAVYFKGIWKYPFKKENTNIEVFYEDENKQSLTEMMHLNTIFNFAISEDLQASLLELPYKDNSTSMFIILPLRTSKKAFTNVLRKLNGKNLLKIFDGIHFSEIEISVMLPKFSIEQETKLKNVLEALGIGDLFSLTADLSELTGKKELTLDDALHKAKIVVNEEGSEAAAATVIYSYRSSRPVEPTTFHCNRPFIFFIYDKTSRSILFEGIFRRPQPLKV